MCHRGLVPTHQGVVVFYDSLLHMIHVTVSHYFVGHVHLEMTKSVYYTCREGFGTLEFGYESTPYNVHVHVATVTVSALPSTGYIPHGLPMPPWQLPTCTLYMYNVCVCVPIVAPDSLLGLDRLC